MSKYTLSAIYKYKDIITFCIFSAISFIFMSRVVESVDPVISTFITYSITAIFFTVINLKHIKEMLIVVVEHKGLVFKINISTFINTLLAFYVVLFISPISYIMVFFSGLSFFNAMYARNVTNKLELFFNTITIILALGIGFLISNAELLDTLIGLSLTLISTLFGAFYMRESATLHLRAGITVSQILSIRFYLVIILCGFYSLAEINKQGISFNDLGLLSLIAVTGSIIPLFLMQKSIKALGPKTTSQFTPLTPVLCLIFMTLIGYQQFSILEITLTLLVAFSMIYQAKFNHSSIKEQVHG